MGTLLNTQYKLMLKMSLKGIMLLPLLALLLVVSDVEGGALRAVRCPGTADVVGCDGGECQVTCSGGQVKTLHCDTNTYYTKTRGRATLVIARLGSGGEDRE